MTSARPYLCDEVIRTCLGHYSGGNRPELHWLKFRGNVQSHADTWHFKPFQASGGVPLSTPRLPLFYVEPLEANISIIEERFISLFFSGCFCWISFCLSRLNIVGYAINLAYFTVSFIFSYG